jgi:hypothetical protein
MKRSSSRTGLLSLTLKSLPRRKRKKLYMQEELRESERSGNRGTAWTRLLINRLKVLNKSSLRRKRRDESSV